MAKRGKSFPQAHKIDVLLNRYGMRELSARLGVSPSTIRRWRIEGTPMQGHKGKGRRRKETRPASEVSRLYGNLGDKSIRPERVAERQERNFKRAIIERNRLHETEMRTTIPGDAQYYSVEIAATSRKRGLTQEAKRKLLEAAREAQRRGFLGWWIAKEAEDLQNRTKKQIGIKTNNGSAQQVSVMDVLRSFPRGRSRETQAEHPSRWDTLIAEPRKEQAFGIEMSRYAGEQRIENLTGRKGMDYLENTLDILFAQNLQVYGIPITAVRTVALRFRRDLTLQNA